MQLATLRKLVVVTIALLLFYQIGSWIAALFGGFWGGVSAIAVVALSLLFARLARGDSGKIAWFLVPTLALAILPVVARIWQTLSNEQSTWFDHLVTLTPLLVGFVAPIVLLLVIYVDLLRKSA